MMTPRLPFSLLTAVFLAVSAPGVANADSPSAPRPLMFSIEAARLRVTDGQSLVEYYVTVDGNTARYERGPSGFVARVGVTFTVSDSAGQVRFAKKLLLRSPALADTTQPGARASFRLHERIALNNGTYTLRWAATDQIRGAGAPEVSLQLPVTVGYPAKRGPQIADIQLLEAYQKTAVPDAFSKGGYSLEGRVSDFYPPEVETLRFYTEVYHTAARLGAGQPMIVRCRVRLLGDRLPVVVGERTLKLSAAEVNPIMTELTLSAVPSGNCELLVEVLGPDGKAIVAGSRLFQRSNPGMPLPQGANQEVRALPEADSALAGTFVADLDSSKLAHYLLALRPVATVVEAGFVQTLAREGTVRQQRAWLLHFWEKQAGGDRADAGRRWAEYLRRIEYVDHTFANATFRAYETDQGRVYLQYGPPDQIFSERNDPKRATANSDGRPYQIWNYYKLKNVTSNSNQTNRTFVFFQRNLGDPSPRLIHSNAIGEASNPDWRSQVGDKFSGRARFDRNTE